MKTDTFTDLLTKKTQIQQLETGELKSIVDQFPYFQSARVLYLKGLRKQDSFKYNNELKITAAYTTDRTILFDFITSDDFNDAKKEIIHQEKKSEQTKIISKKQHLKESLSIGKPLSFSSTESYPFHQWLQLSTKKTIVRTLEQPTKPLSEKEEIIDTFIQNNPKIERLNKDKIIPITITENTSDTALMTETLAKVYLEQKKYENAIQAYKILSLKYPKKNGFFADQIKRVQILQKNK
ncbi:MAG: hypothetical protein ACPGTO_10450 [Polaribacter sp.]